MTQSHTDYKLLVEQAEALLSSERNAIANAANLSALIFSQLAEVNWAGFYFTVGADREDKNPELLLGPFQGLPACIRLPWGQGVCGTAAADRRTLRVDNVHDFEGHIACDSASRSELVVPLIHADRVIGVLDIDSPQAARFSQQDVEGIERLAAVWLSSSRVEELPFN